MATTNLELQRLRMEVYKKEHYNDKISELKEIYDDVNPDTLKQVFDAYEEYRQNVLDCEW